MKMIFKQCILLTAVALMAGGCSEPVKSLPGIYEMNENTFTALDETVLSGRQVDSVLDLYKESLSIIVVKDGRNYVFGEDSTVTSLAGESQAISISDKDKVIDQKGSYQSFILRNEDNEIIGIRLTERSNMSSAK